MKVLRFIGIDQNILDYCTQEEQWLYKVFNILQLVLILIVGFSTYYLFEIIFEITALSIVLALFWSFVFYNLYRFILMTTSGKKGEGLLEQVSLLFPNLFKIGVVAFFAVFISLPVELFINKDFIQAKLPEVLNNKIVKVKTEIDSIYHTQYQEIDNKKIAMQLELDELDTLIHQQEIKMQESSIKEEQHQIFIYLNKLNAELILKNEKYSPVINTLKLQRIETLSRQLSFTKDRKAREEIEKLIEKLSGEGLSIILVSSELDEEVKEFVSSTYQLDCRFGESREQDFLSDIFQCIKHGDLGAFADCMYSLNLLQEFDDLMLLF